MPSPRRNIADRWPVAFLALTAAAGVVLVAASLRRGSPRAEPVRGATAVGDATCLSCHRDKAGFEATAHRLTTRLPSRDAILGSMRRGENVLRTTNPALHYRIDADSTGFLQTAVVGTG